MGSATTVRVEFSGLDQLRPLQALVDPQGFAKLAAAGMRYASGSVPAAVAQQISQRYAISSSRVKQDVAGPSIRGSGYDLEAVLRFSRRPPTGMQFRPRMAGPDLRLTVERGKQTTVRHGFIGQARGRTMTLVPDRSKRYKRDVQAGRPKPRAALKVVYGQSIGAIYLGQARFGGEIRSAVETRIEERFATGIERELSRRARGF